MKKGIIIFLILIIIVGIILFIVLTQDREEQNMNQDKNQDTSKFIGSNYPDNINFNLDTGTVILNSGYEMPLNGIGTYSLTKEECYQAISSALDAGVRLIDTAYMYHNEEEIGRAIRDSGIPREEIFVITKIYPTQYNNPEEAIELALEKLDIGYIDMMLLHHSGSGDVDAYHVMEKYVEQEKNTLPWII